MNQTDQIVKSIDEIKTIVVRLETKMEADREKLSALGNTMWGHNEVPGVEKRVDRIEQAQGARTKVALAGFSILSLIGVKPLLDLIKTAFGTK